jgi:hypothetical protein
MERGTQICAPRCWASEWTVPWRHQERMHLTYDPSNSTVVVCAIHSGIVL